MKVWSYYNPTKVFFGRGCLKKVKNAVDFFRPKKVMLVTGKRSMKKLGITDRIIGYLEDYDVILYNEAKQNPDTNTVKRGIRLLKKEKCDLVIGLGGGSAIDTAKAISILAKNNGPIEEYLYGHREIIRNGYPVIAIPTTAGTGSEVTRYASIVDEKRKLKLSLTHEYIHPNIAIVDPTLTITLPKFLTAITGLDALSQCIEAYWSKNHTPISDIFALKGIELISKNLVNAYNYPENIEFREKMALASMFSGMAIDVAKTTIVHSVSYPLTVHFGVPHGLACSLTLTSFMKYNSKVAEDRILEISRILNLGSIEECIEKIEEIILKLKVPRKLSEVGIQKKDIETIVEKGFRPDRAINNPRKVTKKDLKIILEELL